MSFHDAFTREDFDAIQQLVDVVGEAPARVDCVFDYSGTTGAGNAFRGNFIDMAQRPRPISEMRRIVIAANPDILNLARVFAAAQVFIGSNALEIVKNAQEARVAMGHDTLDLQPTELEGLPDLVRTEP